MMPKLKVKSAWRESLLRNLRNGRSLTVASRMLNIGASKITQERRRDKNFDTEMTELGHPRTTMLM